MNPAAPVTTHCMPQLPQVPDASTPENRTATPTPSQTGDSAILGVSPIGGRAMSRVVAVLVVLVTVCVAAVPAAEPTPAERGKTALTTTPYIPGFWTARATAEAWRQWGL